MIPRKVVLENFLSFGKPGVAVEFTDDEPLWVLCGPNGVGKSAVFDAIAYALFDCHRGTTKGGRGMDELIRHGTNGFHIEFEFGVGGREYRITRSRTSKSVERAFEMTDGAWKPIDLGRGSVKSWVEQKLGLTFEQFTASVLLRQGEADAIITATGKARLEMLKKIIGVERYERLSERVKKGTTLAEGKKKSASADAARVPAVTDEERAAATDEQVKAEREHAEKQEAEQTAVARIARAQKYTQLAQVVAELSAQLDAASVRRAKADRIHADHARLADLRTAVPVLARLIPARAERDRLAPLVRQLESEEITQAKRLTGAVAAHDTARADTTEHARRADAAATELKQRAADRKADESALKVAEEVEGIDAQLREFPTDLDDQLRTASVDVDRKQQTANEAREALAAAQALLKQREKELKDFDKVEIGATCSRCRQPVTAEHAENERRALFDEVEHLRTDKSTAETCKAEADAELTAATNTRDELGSKQAAREKLTNHRTVLARHHAADTAATIRARLAENATAVAQQTAREAEERAKASAADQRANTAEVERADAEQRLAAARSELAAARGEYVAAVSAIEALVPSLTGEWAAAWESVSAPQLEERKRDLAALTASGVEADFRALDDDALDTDRTNRLNAARKDIEAIPEIARVSVSQAEAAAKAARQDAQRAAESLANVKDELQKLCDRQAEHEQLVAAEKCAETDARIHDKLNRLLGADGLQRELVRSAERQIVRFADETVRHLSDGDLSIELDDAEDGPDKAFSLRVRRADDPTPIGVQYLSGSQKFRVAVAVALAIGRFATSGTQARPLESVIIDEGFGSLDKDGLRCMADELHRVKDKLELKRVILVSHQEEFVSRFPVGWRLSRGDAGTTAEPFRR